MGNLVASSKGNWKGDKDQWILFSDIEGLVVEGGGEINGQGSSWWEHKGSRPTVRITLGLSFSKHFSFVLSQIKMNFFFFLRLGIEVQELQQP